MPARASVDCRSASLPWASCRRAPPDRSIAAARNGEREQGREYCARAPDGPVENDPAAEAQNDPAQRARNGPADEGERYRPCRDRRRAPAAHYDRRSGINPPSPTLCRADRCISLSAPFLGTPPSGWSRATIGRDRGSVLRQRIFGARKDAQSPAMISRAPRSGPSARADLRVRGQTSAAPPSYREGVDRGARGRLASGSSVTITTRPIALTFFSGAIPGPLRGVVLGLSCGSSSTGPSGALAQYSRPCSRSPFRAAAMDWSGGARGRSIQLSYRRVRSIKFSIAP